MAVKKYDDKEKSSSGRSSLMDAAISAATGNPSGSSTYRPVSKGTSGSSSASKTPTKGNGYVTGGYTTGGLYGSAFLEDNPYWKGPTMTDLSRRPDLAGKYAIDDGRTTFYDENGYAIRSYKGAADYKLNLDRNVVNGKYANGGAWTDQEILTADDLKRISEIRAGIGSMYTSDQANELANQIRRGYGYVIDKNGLVTDLNAGFAVDANRERFGLPTGALDKYKTDFTSGNMLGYVSPYADDIESLLSDIRGSSFEDWTQGDDYQYLKDKYIASGQNAMQDVIGDVSARTGGYASSYATSAAGQAYNQHLSALEDAARAMYADEYGRMVDQLGIYADLESAEYGKYLDLLNQWNADRNFAYGVSRDQLEDQRYNDQLEYDRGMETAQMLAAYGDFSGFKALGYTDEQIKTMQAAYQAQLAASSKKSSSSGGSSGGSSGTSEPRLTASQTLAALEGGLRNQSVLDAYEYWYGEPFDDGKKSGGEPITDVSQLSPKAMSIASGMSRANSPSLLGTFAEQIEKALSKGEISEAEADFLLKAMGY